MCIIVSPNSLRLEVVEAVLNEITMFLPRLESKIASQLTQTILMKLEKLEAEELKITRHDVFKSLVQHINFLRKLNN